MPGGSVPRTRRETRAAVLESLLRTGSAMRGGLARDTRMTEASISRIVTELRGEKLIDEFRQPMPSGGAHTSIVALNAGIRVLGIELSETRLSFGVGDLAGRLDYTERMRAAPGLTQEAFELLFYESLCAVNEWSLARGIRLRQAAMSVPGYGRWAGRPVYDWDMGRMHAFLAEQLPGVPVALANSVIAHSAYRRYARPLEPGESAPSGDHLLLFVGRGVGGVMVHAASSTNAFSVVEIGHMVMQRDGLECRCGHRGCLEAYTSLAAVGPLIGFSDVDLVARGEHYPASLDVVPGCEAALADRLDLLGMALGNALNLKPVGCVHVSGWPSLLPAQAQAAMLAGLGRSLLGGYDPARLEVGFIEPSIGYDPKAALALAAYSLVRGGGLDETAGAALDDGAQS